MLALAASLVVKLVLTSHVVVSVVGVARGTPALGLNQQHHSRHRHNFRDPVAPDFLTSSDISEGLRNFVGTSSRSRGKSSPSSWSSSSRPTVNITAIFEDRELEEFTPVFYNALTNIANESSQFRWSGHVMRAVKDLKAMVSAMCSHFKGDKSQYRLIIVFGKIRTVHTVNVMSEALGIPVLGYILKKRDGHLQVRRIICFCSS